MPTDQITDGRIERGIRRRRQLVEATLRVIVRDGVAGVTYRSVAAEAGLPKTAATYYFDSVDEMLVAALTDSAQDYAAELERVLEAGVSTADLAGLLAAHLREHRDRCVAEYELHLLAARRPALRPAALRWSAMMEDFARRYTGDPATAAAFAAAVDGLALQALLREEPPEPQAIQAVLDQVLLRAPRRP